MIELVEAIKKQWRQRVSNIGGRPSPSLLPCSPPLPSPPSHPLPTLSPPPPSPPLPLEVGPLNPVRGSGGALLAPPAGSGAEPQPKSNFVHFSLKIRHLVAKILMILVKSQLTEKQVVYIVKTIFTGNINIGEEVTQWHSKSLRAHGSTVTWGPSLSLPSTSPSLPFPSLFPSSSPAQPLPLPRSGVQIQQGGLGERCKFPQRGLGRNRIWCILALKSVIRWQQF